MTHLKVGLFLDKGGAPAPKEEVAKSIGDLLSALKTTAVGILSQAEVTLPPEIASTVKNILQTDTSKVNIQFHISY